MTGDGVDAVIAAMDELPADAAEMPDAVLVSRMQRLVALRAMVDATLVEQLAVFDARAGARYDGQTSTRAWLRSRLRLGGQAGDLLLTARRLGALPQVSKAFAAGEITLEHAAVLARLAGEVGAAPLAEYEPILLELACQASPAKLRVACEHLRQLLDPDGDGDEAARQRRRRYLTAGRTVDGTVHLQGLLDATGGDVVLAALRAAMPVPAEYEERTPAQRRADALVDICAGWLASGEAPTTGGLRPQLQVTVSLRSLRSRSPLGLDHQQLPHPRFSGQPFPSEPDAGLRFPGQPGAGLPLPPTFAHAHAHAAAAADGGACALGQSQPLWGDVPVLADGWPVAVSDARRIACDAGIIPVVLGTGSEPLDIGRQSRVVPAGLRRALHLRDGGCRFAGCDRPASWCDAHHIRHWVDGGETALDNLILMCQYHHTLLHEGWRLHGDPHRTVRFQRPDGTRLGISSEPRCRLPTRGP